MYTKTLQQEFNIRNHASPNYSTNSHGAPIVHEKQILMLHVTLGDAQSSLDWLSMSPQERENRFGERSYSSAHMLIGRDGTKYELIAPHYRAWHAGNTDRFTERAVRAFGDTSTDPNDACVGIELEAFKDAPDDITTEQYHALQDAMKYYIRHHNCAFNGELEHMLTHHDVTSYKPNIDTIYTNLKNENFGSKKKFDIIKKAMRYCKKHTNKVDMFSCIINNIRK